MVAASSPLPDLNTLDQETLKELLRTTHEQLLCRQSEIEHLKLLLAKLQRMRFGRKSEKLERQIEQLELWLEDLEAKPAGSTSPGGKPVYSCSFFYPYSYRETEAASVARPSTADHTDAFPQVNGLPGLWRRVTQVGRRCFRDVGVCARVLSGGSACAS